VSVSPTSTPATLSHGVVAERENAPDVWMNCLPRLFRIATVVTWLSTKFVSTRQRRLQRYDRSGLSALGGSRTPNLLIRTAFADARDRMSRALRAPEQGRYRERVCCVSQNPARPLLFVSKRSSRRCGSSDVRHWVVLKATGADRRAESAGERDARRGEIVRLGKVNRPPLPRRTTVEPSCCRRRNSCLA
jgi:hypothetical protein